MKNDPSLTNFFVKHKRKAKACTTRRTGRATAGSVDLPAGLCALRGVQRQVFFCD
jgi:hypothetical protein